MGSAASRQTPCPSGRRRSSKLSCLLFCGASSSHAATLEVEDYPTETVLNSAEHHDLAANVVQNTQEESCSTSSMGTGFSSTCTETRTSSEGNTAGSDGASFNDGTRNVETCNDSKCLSDRIGKKLIASSQVSVDYCCGETYRNSPGSTSASPSFKEQQSLDSVLVNVSANEDAVNEIDNSADKGASQICSDPSCLSTQGLGDSNSEVSSVENNMAEETTIHYSDSGSMTPVSDLPVTYHTHGDGSIIEAIPSSLGLIMSNGEQAQGDGSILHVDVVGISSNILPPGNVGTSSREARRNSQRLFWDPFSRRGSGRLSDSPSIFLSSDDNDDLGSHDRWLLDFSGEFFDDWAGGDSVYLGSRIHSLNDQRRHSRSEAINQVPLSHDLDEILERLHGRHDENGRRTTFCPSGLHPDGTCSCDLFLMTETSAPASISRIVMLAEALFEVLEEIHRHPVSLSLSVISVPAPASVVDSLPIKSHKKVDTAIGGDTVEQCYICLAEYEEGDKMRILPCHHEYHMSCVDKWLKEIHGVCPLCRGDVRQVVSEPSVSSPEIPFL